MKQIYSRDEKKMVDMRSLKNLTHPKHPGYKFFAHKTYNAKGYSVSEESTGGAVVQFRSTLQHAIYDFNEFLNAITPERMKEVIENAREVVKNDKRRS